jgi:hypothetical protein
MNVLVEEFKKAVNFDLMEEEARWEIYSKSLEKRKMNNPIEAFVL